MKKPKRVKITTPKTSFIKDEYIKEHLERIRAKSTIHKFDLKYLIALDVDISLATADRIIHIICGLLGREIITKKKASLYGLGTFKVKKKNGTSYHNVNTRKLEYFEGKKVIHFKPTPEIQRDIQKLKKKFKKKPEAKE